MTLSHKISLKLHLGVGYSEMCIILTIAALANHSGSEKAVFTTLFKLWPFKLLVLWEPCLRKHP